MEFSVGDTVFNTTSTGLWVPAKVVGFVHDGHVKLEYHHGGLSGVNHQCPMDSLVVSAV